MVLIYKLINTKYPKIVTRPGIPETANLPTENPRRRTTHPNDLSQPSHFLPCPQTSRKSTPCPKTSTLKRRIFMGRPSCTPPVKLDRRIRSSTKLDLYFYGNRSGLVRGLDCRAFQLTRQSAPCKRPSTLHRKLLPRDCQKKRP